jgi:hypothetical protein
MMRDALSSFHKRDSKCERERDFSLAPRFFAFFLQAVRLADVKQRSWGGARVHYHFVIDGEIYYGS